MLALKETELDEAKTELTIQSEALDVATKALRNNRLWLEQSVAKVEETQSLLEKLNKKVHRMEPQHRVASNGNHADSAMQTETFLNQVQQLKEQNERLTIHLKEAEKEVKEAWSIIARSPREETSGDAAKRKRVKGEQVDNESDTLRPFAAAVKRARQERIDQVLEEVHHLIPVVLEGRR